MCPLLWAERTHGANLFNLPQVAGYWVLKTADFIDDVAGPRLANARVVSVPGDAFNETGGFAPDSRPFVFASDGPAQNFWKSQFVLAAAEAPTSFEVQTELGAYNEQTRFTPDGRMTWMSNVGSTLQSEDWWVMNADGTAKTRLS